MNESFDKIGFMVASGKATTVERYLCSMVSLSVPMLWKIRAM